MTRDTKKTGRAALDEIDIRLDGLLGKLGTTLGDLVDRLDAGDTGEIRRSHEFPSPRGPIRAETGIRIRVAGADVQADRARATAPDHTSPKPEPDAPVQPTLDTYTSEGRWRLTADLPGVDAAELDIRCEGARLLLRTTGRRRYAAEATLPPEVDPEDRETLLRNGILEVSFGLREAQE